METLCARTHKSNAIHSVTLWTNVIVPPGHHVEGGSIAEILVPPQRDEMTALEWVIIIRMRPEIRRDLALFGPLLLVSKWLHILQDTGDDLLCGLASFHTRAKQPASIRRLRILDTRSPRSAPSRRHARHRRMPLWLHRPPPQGGKVRAVDLARRFATWNGAVGPVRDNVLFLFYSQSRVVGQLEK
jgi:hypothetical protein